ncbi:MAG TPA: response regulator [Verrucomicrobiae bacterium]|nr:response regulator [Verrucomicrobiae bacterium]
MSVPPSANTGIILLAEDEETDVVMFRLALKRAEMLFPLQVANDGQEAVDYLSGHDPYDNRTRYPLPALIILDLKMPRMSGFDVLAWLSGRPDLRQIPAVVLSSSSYAQDIQRATELGAREYYVKPHSVDALSKLLQSATGKWLQL